MTPDETNKHYRAKDHSKWQNNPLILGLEVHLSATSKKGARCGLCQQLAGKYPKWFIWTGWHEGCMCFKTPVLMTRPTMDAYNRLIAMGEDSNENVERVQAGELVTYLPDGFKTWVRSNIHDEDQFQIAPTWIRENFKTLTQLTDFTKQQRCNSNPGNLF